jgi:hypothetical protein
MSEFKVPPYTIEDGVVTFADGVSYKQKKRAIDGPPDAMETLCAKASGETRITPEAMYAILAGSPGRVPTAADLAEIERTTRRGKISLGDFDMTGR